LLFAGPTAGRRRQATLDKVARAGLSVVSLPMCNMYLQDRRADATTPRWRGVTLLHEMAARGINVAVASDNTRDPFYAYGDLDVLEVYRGHPHRAFRSSRRRLARNRDRKSGARHGAR
jgi:cytosine/adenosine deaminase-related metal-dependent hydrolase